MENNVQTQPDPGLGSLVTGIVNDTQKLLKQQLDMFRHEVQEDFQKTTAAGTVLAMGGVFAMVAITLLCLALVHLLSLVAPNLPLWGCYAIVGVVVAGVAGILIYQARIQFASFNPLPEKTAQAIQENLEWKPAK